MNSTVRMGTLMPTPSVSVPQMTLRWPCLGQALDEQPVLGEHAGVVHADAVAHVAATAPCRSPGEKRKPPMASAMASFSSRVHTLMRMSDWARSTADAWVKCTM